MLDESIVDNAPEGATHYRKSSGAYYKVTGNAAKKYEYYSNILSKWAMSYLDGGEKEELISLGYKLNTIHEVPNPSLLALPENVRPHVTMFTTGEYVLWDETAAHEICRSHYPLVIVQAMQTYTKEYLNKH